MQSIRKIEKRRGNQGPKSAYLNPGSDIRLQYPAKDNREGIADGVAPGPVKGK